MTRDSFKKIIIDTVTEGRILPTEPNELALKTIIDNALRWFKQNDDESHEFEYIVLSGKNFNTDLFKSRRQIKMPDCVESITLLQEPGSKFSFSGIAGANRGNTHFDRALAISGNSDTMLYAVVANYYQDFIASNFMLRTVAYEYNPHSKMLTITGRDIGGDLIAGAYVHLCEESIFENDRFHRYVAAKIKMSFSRVFGLVTVKTIGGLPLNLNDYKSEGKEELQKVETEIKEARAGDFIDFF